MKPAMLPKADYLLAKLEAIHEDVTILKKQVDELRHLDTGRKSAYKVIVVVLTIIGATMGWLVDNAVAVAKHITYKV